jgi:hypothetical protein
MEDQSSISQHGEVIRLKPVVLNEDIFMARQSLDPAAGKLLRKRAGMNLGSSSMDSGGSVTRCAAKRYNVVETLTEEFMDKFATALALLRDDILSIKAHYDTSRGKL